MRMVVEKLTAEDIIDITAYLASLPISPSGKPAPPTPAGQSVALNLR